MRQRKAKTLLDLLRIAIIGFAGALKIANELSSGNSIAEGIDPRKVIDLEKGKDYREVQALQARLAEARIEAE